MRHILIAHKPNFELSHDDWVFDTGAANLMTANKNSLVDYVELTTPLKFGAAEGGCMLAYGYGKISIQMEYMKVIIKQVYYVLKVVANLISSQDLFNSSYLDILQPDGLQRITNMNSKLAGYAKPEGRLFIIHPQKPKICSAILSDLLY